jgi:hypothetical protein
MSTSSEVVHETVSRKRSRVSDDEEEEVKHRPRLNSLRSDKRPPGSDLTELERKVVEVLNRYTNGTTSLRTEKID